MGEQLEENAEQILEKAGVKKKDIAKYRAQAKKQMKQQYAKFQEQND